MYCEITDLTVFYDTALLLNSVNAKVDFGEAVSMIGPNGAGKTTCLRAMAGLVQWDKDTLKGTKLGRIILEGSVTFDGMEILGLPSHKIAQKGLILCPERGRPFREMSVIANLRSGAFMSKDAKIMKQNLENGIKN